MITKLVHISDKNIDTISHLNSQLIEGSDETDQSKLERLRLKRFLNKTMDGELTNLQRYCLTEHYLKEKKQKEIARELGVAPSTVSRHISKAVSKLKTIASYYS